MQDFDAVKIKNEIIEWIRDWFSKNGSGCNAVVGISGGKDSSVVAALCVEALGKDRVIGVLMPYGEQPDIDVAESVVSTLGIQSLTVNIWQCVNYLKHQIKPQLFGETWSAQAATNLPARIRMSTLYAVSQSVNGRVANTCNLSEDWVGYSTRYGDSVGDFSPLSHLTTDEVIEVGLACGLPPEFVYKTPSDGLCGKTDEENLGFTYRQLNKYIRTGVCEDAAVKEMIDKKHKQNLFKLQPMPSFDPGLRVAAE